ncbi:hypothetical protein SMITH_171 [Smithella sp. ME-1]|uniref:Uncharacterized protein n=1 Tax=hydrocarbon metagenome TaxID=938273 RepID=A0A0W8FNB0_9ZZZZ|nr:hypothetical protein SMITH_171 [Smithella sp. ME-1]
MINNVEIFFRYPPLAGAGGGRAVADIIYRAARFLNAPHFGPR